MARINPAPYNLPPVATSDEIRATHNTLIAAFNDVDQNGPVSGGALTVQEEGAPLATAATTLNFVGAGVTVTGATATKTITIPSAAAGSGLKTGILVCAKDAPAFMKTNADYICDGVNDEVQIQAAINAAHAALDPSQTYGAPAVFLSTGAFRLGGSITATSAPILGVSMSNLGTRIYWDGAAGATVITKSVANGDSGGTSFWRMEHLEFLPGTATPGVWLDLSAGSVDQLLDLFDLHFAGGSQAQIKIAGWVNCHWRKLRFDNWATYAISLTPGSTQNNSTFELTDFTSDNQPTGPGRAFIGLDTSANVSNNLGTLRLANGRIEMNKLLTSPPSSIIELITPSPGSSRVIGFELENVSYDDVVSNPSDYIIYSNTANTNVSVSLILINFRQVGLAGILGGTLYSGATVPTVQANYGLAAFNQGGSADVMAGRLQIGGSPTVTSGAGLPTGTEPKGSIYINTTATTASTRLYINTTGSNVWAAFTASA